ncbi:hypothetical protein NPIL_693491 [Nephila pilipes]|uniref:Uncharacterized protein n=1 Tax=Nephila pilipes TaxID=299642 RepID=A0A8X6MY38_NEPPI|nr:hypothetical protein NPIL_693491 [Nephila pilipes]
MQLYFRALNATSVDVTYQDVSIHWIVISDMVCWSVDIGYSTSCNLTISNDVVQNVKYCFVVLPTSVRRPASCGARQSKSGGVVTTFYLNIELLNYKMFIQKLLFFYDIDFQRIPSHIGISDNEVADTLAKGGYFSGFDFYHFNFSRDLLKN